MKESHLCFAHMTGPVNALDISLRLCGLTQANPTTASFEESSSEDDKSLVLTCHRPG